MRCHVYRCRRRADTYVYLAERDAFERVPEPLRSQLGELEFVLELTLDSERKLAREDPERVRANLASAGFHIQYPPPFDLDPHAAG